MAQAVAILPGISRSGSTISALLKTGVEPAAAARFSFLLSIPAVAGAGLLESAGGFPPGSPGAPLLAAGFGVSFLAGLVSLKLLLRVLSGGKLWIFGVYCGALGAVCTLLVLSGV
jgi:undecaprenyl-diphosphatase